MEYGSMRKRIDFVKVFLTLCLAGIYGLASFMFSLGFWAAVSGTSAEEMHNPAATRVAWWLCALPMVGFGVSALWAIRSAYLQVAYPKSMIDSQLSTTEAVRAVVGWREFQVSRLTGWGWILFLAAWIIPAVWVAVIFGDQFNDLPGGVQKYGVISGSVILFGMGYTFFKIFGISIIVSGDSNAGSKSNDGD